MSTERSYLKTIKITEKQLLSLTGVLHQLECEDIFQKEVRDIDKALEKSGIFREGESYQESEPIK